MIFLEIKLNNIFFQEKLTDLLPSRFVVYLVVNVRFSRNATPC